MNQLQRQLNLYRRTAPQDIGVIGPVGSARGGFGPRGGATGRRGAARRGGSRGRRRAGRFLGERSARYLLIDLFFRSICIFIIDNLLLSLFRKSGKQ